MVGSHPWSQRSGAAHLSGGASGEVGGVKVVNHGRSEHVVGIVLVLAQNAKVDTVLKVVYSNVDVLRAHGRGGLGCRNCNFGVSVQVDWLPHWEIEGGQEPLEPEELI